MTKLTEVFVISEKGDPEKFGGDTVLAPGRGKQPQQPRMYKVLLHNDDFTPAHFVVHVLMVVFNKNQGEAWRLTNAAHMQGSMVAGIYTAEVAEQKVARVEEMATAAGHPLRCTAEPE